MKTKKIDRKLTLNKQTVTSLDTSEQQALKGGYLNTRLYGNCYTWYPYDGCYTKPQEYCNENSAIPELCA